MTNCLCGDPLCTWDRDDTPAAVVVCPGCNFTFDAGHTFGNTGLYNCPNCGHGVNEPALVQSLQMENVEQAAAISALRMELASYGACVADTMPGLPMIPGEPPVTDWRAVVLEILRYAQRHPPTDTRVVRFSECMYWELCRQLDVCPHCLENPCMGQADGGDT